MFCASQKASLNLQAINAIASEVHEGSSAVIAVAGTKGIGKSGFARLMVNMLLSTHPKVAYLDTDLGQPEFTVPGRDLLKLGQTQNKYHLFSHIMDSEAAL